MFFNDCDAGREMKTLYDINIEVKPVNLFITLNKGFIRVLELNDILNISYTGYSFRKQVPICNEAKNSLLTFLLKPSITEVQYDCFVGSTSRSSILPKKDFVRSFMNRTKSYRKIIEKMLDND